jgi:hypothetical protein
MPAFDLQCDVLVVGDTLGAVAAAAAAARRHAHTCLIAAEDWLGGQATAQGVPFDEGLLQFPKGYADLRASIRKAYLDQGNVVAASRDNAGDEGPDNQGPYFNPGSCWVSRLCAEPAVVRRVIEDQVLQPLVAAGSLTIKKGYVATAAWKRGDTVLGVGFMGRSAPPLRVGAAVTIDATDLGDLLPLLCTDCYRAGMESRDDTGEPDAPAAPHPECVQPFTFSFALERMPDGEDHTIARPADYDASLYAVGGEWAGHVFAPNGNGWSFWNYRRTLAVENFQSGVPSDVAMINWDDGNDFNKGCGPDGCNLIDKPADVMQRILAKGRQHALGFVYYLQHDVPRDSGSGTGYPNLKLRPDLFATADGLSRTPYIRESRRLRALTTIKEHNLIAVGARAQTRYDDSVGLARYYALDRHPCGSGPAEQTTVSAGAAQVPLGALIPEKLDALLAGSLNIGSTHISNGYYRLHPAAWSIGEAAGALAASSALAGQTPRQRYADPRALRQLQYELTSQGSPLYWWSDVKRADPFYSAAHMMGASGAFVGDSTLEFKPTQALTRGEAAVAVARELALPAVAECHAVFTDVPCSHPAYPAIQALFDRRVTSGVGNNQYGPDQTITRGQLLLFLVRASCDPVWDENACPLVRPKAARYTDVLPDSVYYGYVETAAARGWLDDVPGGGKFTPDAAVTRAQAVVWLLAHMQRALALK